MKHLFNYICELLSEIPELRYIDLNTGQLQEEKPSVAYPCALIDISLPRREDIDRETKRNHAEFTVTLAVKAIGETNKNAPEQQRSLAMQYFDLVEKIDEKLHFNCNNGAYYPFTSTSMHNVSNRRGLKAVAISFQTAWNAHIASS